MGEESAMDDADAGRRGRPRGGITKPMANRRRNALNIRVRDVVLDELRRSADAGQRSLSEECERRLEAAQNIGMLVHTIEQLRVEVASLAAQVARLAAVVHPAAGLPHMNLSNLRAIGAGDSGPPQTTAALRAGDHPA